MLELIVIYILGVLLVGGISAWFVIDTDEDVTLLDLIKLMFCALLSWVAVLLNMMLALSVHIEEYSSKVIIKKGKEEEDV